MKKKFLPLLLVGVVVISLPLILSPIVHAEEENPLSVTLCVKNSGTVFMIGEGFKVADCKNNDKLINIDLSQGTQGPKGDKGDKGDTGDIGLQGEVGPQGLPGVDGKDGINGQDGSDGIDGVSEWERKEHEGIAPGQDQTVTANCSEGKKIVGGGYLIGSPLTMFYPLSSYPDTDSSWTASVHRSSTTPANWSLKVYAICVTAN